jgi:HSP20 family protein
MPALIHPHASLPPTSPARTRYCHPHYECEDLAHELKITVFLPGVDSTGVEIASRGADLVVTGRRSHPLRVNWQALHLEGVQRDYQLRLRLGAGFSFNELRASLDDGMLVLTLPKKPVNVAGRGRAELTSRERRVA